MTTQTQAALVQAFPVGDWTMQTSTKQEVLPYAWVERLLKSLDAWVKVYEPGGTWVEQTYGIPSLFVRFDFSDHGIYEIEDKPCGMHVCNLLNPDFAQRLAALRREWPAFKWICGERRGSDDEGWLGEPISFENALECDDLLLVRCMPEDERYHVLSSRSVSTLKNEGVKTYGVPMGLWRIVKPNGDGNLHPAFPETGNAFCIKPVQGTRNRGVGICLNGANGIRKEGKREIPYLLGEPLFRGGKDILSRTEADKTVRKWGSAVLQDYVRPSRLAHVPEKNVMLRFYFGFSPEQNCWVPLGGVWLASPALRVHGEEQTISGPLVFQ